MATNRNEFSRSDRVRKQLIREVSDIIATDVKDIRLQGKIISVTDVELTQDLRFARIYISVMADEDVQNEVMTILMEAKPQIRSSIGKRIRLRYTPEIDIRLDTSLERGTRVSALLDQIARGEV